MHHGTMHGKHPLLPAHNSQKYHLPAEVAGRAADLVHDPADAGVDDAEEGEDPAQDGAHRSRELEEGAALRLLEHRVDGRELVEEPDPRETPPAARCHVP